MPVHALRNTVEEEAKQDLEDYLEHQGKLEVAAKAILVQDMQELLRANRANQQRVEDELMGGKGEDEEMGDINIDSPTSIHHHHPTPNDGTLKAILTAGALAAGVLAGAMLFRSNPAPPPSHPGPADSAYKVLFYDRDGKPITVPHLSERK